MPDRVATGQVPRSSHRSEPITPIRGGERVSTIFEANSVQDRIRIWQAQGAASAPSPDALSTHSIPLSDCEPKSAPPRRHRRNHRTSERGEERDTTLSPGSGDQLDGDICGRSRGNQSRTAPRKRIVSDEHWRTTRSDVALGNDYNLDGNDKVKFSDADYVRSPGRSRKEDREERRKKRREARTSRLQGSVGRSEALLETPDSTTSLRMPSARTSVHQSLNGEGTGGDDPNSTERQKIFDRESMDFDACTGLEEKGRPGQSRYAETLGQPSVSGCDGTHGASNSKTSRLFRKTREIFTKTEPAPVVDSRIPSIEAWLDEQPDPFLEQEIYDLLSPRPLKASTEKTELSFDIPIATDSSQMSNPPLKKGNHKESPARRERRKDRQTLPSTEPLGTLDTKKPRNLTVAEDVGRRRDDSGTLHGRSGGKSRISVNVDDPILTTDSTSMLLSPARKTRQSRSSSVEVDPPPYLEHETYQATPLSTVTSIEDTSSYAKISGTKQADEVEICGVKRKLTTHEDLMSVLSRPRGRNNLGSGRHRKRANNSEKLSASEILKDLKADEEKFSRELQTLVDGVIPVLLQSVLSKSGSSAAAGLFTTSASASDDYNFTKPIIDMGVALERLKSSHARTPLNNVDTLLSWALTTHKAYSDYLVAWKLGFQDVVVNLAPLNEGQSGSEIDAGMARDANGDVVDSDGRKVDVAYLLKRPLVRVKNLSKTFNRIDDLISTPRSKRVADAYDGLTALARKRYQEEQARLEDETAANIDTTRTRDLRTLASITGISVDKTRRVKARDCFGLSLYHTSGQRVDCRIEMILRDSDQSSLPNGDVLFCEVEDLGKWLLFPPVDIKSISARKGQTAHDLVVMVRGHKLGQDWHELLALKADDEETVTEWMGMLGSNPLPPKLNRTPSFLGKDDYSTLLDFEGTSEATNSHSDSITPFLKDLERPIGEPSVLGKSDRIHIRDSLTPKAVRYIPQLNLGGGLKSKTSGAYAQISPTASRGLTPSNVTISSGRSTFSSESSLTTSSRSTTQLLLQPEANPELRRLNAGGNALKIVSASSQGIQSIHKNGQCQSENKEDLPRWRKSRTSFSPSSEHQTVGVLAGTTVASAQDPREASFSPSPALPSISKVRPNDSSNPLTIRQKNNFPGGSPGPSTPSQLLNQDRNENIPQGGRRRRPNPSPAIFTEDIPPVPAHAIRPRDVTPKTATHAPDSKTPVPPAHRITTPVHAGSDQSSHLSRGGPVEPQTEQPLKRRSSSPLKHEYAPSTASNSPDNSDSEALSDVSSETSEEFASEAEDMATPLVAVKAAGQRRHLNNMRGVSNSLPSKGTRTLAPSDSASQGPYRSVPPTSSDLSNQKGKTIAMVCSWTDQGGWNPLHPDECSIVVSPGLIEAFEMSAAHSGDKDDDRSYIDPDRHKTMQPLVAFELTPLVPLRRGTALDISIRSPPTSKSKVKSTNNVMFRSRNAGECEALYAMINWARINNPTYIALERARPKRQPAVTFALDTSQSRGSGPGSWFSFGGSQKRSSYRASVGPGPGAPSPSIGGASEASITSMASAFLKRFGGNSAFNLHKSSVARKNGSGGTGSSLYSSSSGTQRSSSNSSPVTSQLGASLGKDGQNVPATSAEAANGGGMVNNMKIRLYIREDMTKWINLGAARLTILPPPGSEDRFESRHASAFSPAQPSSGVADPREPGRGSLSIPSSTHTPHRIHNDGREKRIIVSANKQSDVIYIDRVLGESCFERVMQSGIAVNVWEEDKRIGDRGGVIGGRSKTYMFQFPGAKEAAWVFGIVGTYRYE